MTHNGVPANTIARVSLICEVRKAADSLGALWNLFLRRFVASKRVGFSEVQAGSRDRRHVSGVLLNTTR